MLCIIPEEKEMERESEIKWIKYLEENMKPATLLWLLLIGVRRRKGNQGRNRRGSNGAKSGKDTEY